MFLRFIIFVTLLVSSNGYAFSERYATIGNLEVIEMNYELKDAPVIFYLHGFGGTAQNAADFFRPHIYGDKVFEKIHWVFVQSPKINGTPSWYDHVTDDVPTLLKSLEDTRVKLDKMVIAGKFQDRHVVWAGFSQGAIMAADQFLQGKTEPWRLIVNSGGTLDLKEWSLGAVKRRGKKFYMTHSPKDDVIPIRYAREMEQEMKSGGMVGDLEQFSRGHSIPVGLLRKYVTEMVSGEK